MPIKSNKNKSSNVNHINQGSTNHVGVPSPVNHTEKKVNFQDLKNAPSLSSASQLNSSQEHYIRPNSSKIRKMVMDEDVKHILSKSNGVSIETFMHKLPELLERSRFHFRYLEPEIEKY